MIYEKHIWLSQTDLSQLHSSYYWNDVEVEKEKIWSKVDTDIASLEQNFSRKRIKEQFDTMIKVVSRRGGGRLRVLVLGAGSAYLKHKSYAIIFLSVRVVALSFQDIAYMKWLRRFL